MTTSADHDQSLYLLDSRPVKLDSPSTRNLDPDVEQHNDPDGTVSGAKGSKLQGRRSSIDPLEDMRAGSWKVDKASEGYISMAEVKRHNLAQDAWVVVEGKVFE